MLTSAVDEQKNLLLYTVANKKSYFLSTHNQNKHGTLFLTMPEIHEAQIRRGNTEKLYFM